jgi:hypothetical protein
MFATVVLAVPAVAQVTTGRVVGTVTDTQGGVIPGATVVLISDTRGTKMPPVTTGAEGNFVIPNIAPDKYTVEVTMPSFKTATRAGVSVSGGEIVTVPVFQLQVGGTNEIITVTDSAPLIQSQSGERSYAVSAEQVMNLPFLNRGFTELATLAPGMNADGTRQGGGGWNNVMMDGVSTMDTGNNAAVLNLNTEAIAEVKVLTSSYQAEYGRASGAQITAVTKSGTNRFHGSAYDVERNSDWNSNSWANKLNGQPKTTSKEKDFGYTIGGPVGKVGGNNKLFFFHSMEWRPRESGNQVRQFRFPTALERDGDFSQTLDNQGALYNLIKNPNVTNPCTTTDRSGCWADGGVTGKIPSSALYAPGLAILRMYPMPNMAQAASTNYNYEQIQPLQTRLNTQPSLRFDYQPAQALRFTVKYAGERQRKQIFQGTLPGFNDVAVPKPVITTISTTVNYTINPTTFIEGTYGMTQNELAGCANFTTACNQQTTNGNNSAVPMSPVANKFTAGLGDLPLLFPDGVIMNPDYYEYQTLIDMGAPFFQNGRIELPQVITSWGSRVGNIPPSNPYPGWLNINRAQDLAVSLTKVSGRHTFKAGYYHNHSFKAQHRGGGGPGTISFANDTSNPLDTTFGFANAATGTFQNYTQLDRFVEGGWTYNNAEAFIQDNWKVNGRLTLDYGLRFVSQGPQYDNHYQSSNFLPEKWDPAQAPQVYVWGCRNGVYPCTGNNRAAMNPITGQFLAQNVSSIAVNTLVPNTGNVVNGIFSTDPSQIDPALAAGLVKGDYSNKAYTWPTLALAPRVGFAYDLSGNQSFVIRGGGGMFYDRPEGNSVYGLISNPPFAKSVTVNYGDFRQLGSGGLSFAGAPNLQVYEYDSKLPTSVQWNGGVQFSLPWSSALDIEYVGNHNYNQLIPNQGVNLNQFDLGAFFLPQNQDRTQTATILGSQVLPQSAIRSYRGYGTITQQWSRNWRTFHSVQTSYNRRFRDGISASINYTLSFYDHAQAGARLEHDPVTGAVGYRADQAKADQLFATSINPHNLRANFVWDMPDWSPEKMLFRGVAAVINDWQLSGIYRFESGNTYAVGTNFSNNIGNNQLTGSPDYAARVRLVGDPGKGCSDDQYRQFNTSVVSGAYSAFAPPTIGSDGLESGNAYLRGCPNNTWDMAIARNIRLGSGRQVQLQVQMFNAFNNVQFNGRSTNFNVENQTTNAIFYSNGNFQFNEDGSMVSTRVIPQNAGFGAANSARNLRSIQARVSFSF